MPLHTYDDDKEDMFSAIIIKLLHHYLSVLQLQCTTTFLESFGCPIPTILTVPPEYITGVTAQAKIAKTLSSGFNLNLDQRTVYQRLKAESQMSAHQLSAIRCFTEDQ